MSSPWNDRAEAYRSSVTHATDADLDIVVEMCDPHEGVKVLDVATGGGHVARRLRALGAEVVTTDAAPGMQPDVVCRAEDLPFADGSFDVVVSRIAPHHFDDIGRAVGEMGRIAEPDDRDRGHPVHRRGGRGGREAARSDARSQLLRGGVARVCSRAQASRSSGSRPSRRHTTSTIGSHAATASAQDAERVRELLAPWSSEDGSTWSDVKVILKARRSQT